MARIIKPTSFLFLCFLFFVFPLKGQDKALKIKVEDAMLRASQFMVDSVSTNGGYLWSYLPDFSRRWGEMEAYPTMIWLQHPGTTSMGQLFLDAYQATKNEFYYQAAEKAAAAIIWGQSHLGGWNYMIDFAGDRSLKHWYNTIGKNGWRLEEFHHYYGNSTFDDDVTSDAARFLLRIYLEKFDPKYKPSLDKAINFIIQSQYPLGGWPQRYPLMDGFSKNGMPDYSSFYTFNDDVIWENVNFLMLCYQTLGEERFLDPIRRGMDFYIISQHSSGGWGQQLDMELNVAGARSYEPLALLPATTLGNALHLLNFYRLTGDKKYLEPVPKAIEWLEKMAFDAEQRGNGRHTHPTFVDPHTQKPVYVHRKGSNVNNGQYYVDENDGDLLSHYHGKRYVAVENLVSEYERVLALPVDELLKKSPLLPGPFLEKELPQKHYNLNRSGYVEVPEDELVRTIIGQLDKQDRWLVQNANTSNPYVCDTIVAIDGNNYCATLVGDHTDTSPFRDQSEQWYISTGAFIRNMRLLIQYYKN